MESNQTPVSDSKTQLNTKPQWGALEALFVGIFGSFAFQMLVGAGFVTFIPDFEGVLESASNSTVFVLNLVAIVAGFVPILLYLLAHRYSLKSVGFAKSPKMTDFGRMLMVYVIYMVVLIASLQAASYFLPQDLLNQDQDIGFTPTSDVVELVIIGVALVVLAPLFEEMIYRGFIFQGFKKSLGFIPALLLSSIIFALVHGQINVGIDTFFLGLGLGYLYHVSGSLWPSIGLHMLKNGVAFSLLFL